MAVIKGFKGIRYDCARAGDIATLVCPPYDVISESERQEYVGKNAYNIVNIELPKGDNKYAVAGEKYEQWRKDGILKQDPQACIYIYELRFPIGDGYKAIKGIVCAVRLEEFENRVILPHERTLSKAKDDRLELLSATRTNVSQIYSMYMDEKAETTTRIASLSASAPDIEFQTDDGCTHRLWIVSDAEQIAGFTREFATRQLYIADGHHRYETALNYRRKRMFSGTYTPEDSVNYTMMFLIDMDNDGLIVFPTHRMVRNLEQFSELDAVERMNAEFNIEKREDLDAVEAVLAAHDDRHAIAFYTGGAYYYLLTLNDMDAVKKMMPDMSDAYCDLDVTVLHSLIFDKVFGITKEDLAKQTKVTYTRSVHEALTGVQNGVSQCCFILNPTKVSQIKDVAKAGEKMPQKSTYFYPKLITGLVMNHLD